MSTVTNSPQPMCPDCLVTNPITNQRIDDFNPDKLMVCSSCGTRFLVSLDSSGRTYNTRSGDSVYARTIGLTWAAIDLQKALHLESGKLTMPDYKWSSRNNDLWDDCTAGDIDRMNRAADGDAGALVLERIAWNLPVFT